MLMMGIDLISSTRASSFSARNFQDAKSFVFFKIVSEFVIDANGDAARAGGVNAKLIVVLELVKLVFPMGWAISFF